MEGDAKHFKGWVEERTVNRVINALQFIGVTAVVRINVRFVDREIQKRTTFQAPHFAFLWIRIQERQGRDCAQTRVVVYWEGGLNLLLAARHEHVSKAQLEVTTHIERSTILNAIEVVDKEAMTQLRSNKPVL